jgi:hypothetical protein
MQGTLAEFTLAQLLQFMSIAERSGTITVRSSERASRLLVDGDRISGWGFDDYDLLETIEECELLPESVRASLNGVIRKSDTPGLSAVVSNLVEPGRWSAFVERILEQEVYPILNSDDGEFEVRVGPCPPAPLRFSLPVNSLILDGSRWESEIEAAEQAGLSVETAWQRNSELPHASTSLDAQQWMIWAALTTPRTIANLARSLCLPNLPTISAVRRLRQLELVVPALVASDDFTEDTAG